MTTEAGLGELAVIHANAWASGSFDAAADIVVGYRDPLAARDLSGAELAAHFAVWSTALAPQDWTVDELIVGEQTAVLRWSVSVTHRARLLRASPSGRTATIHGTDLVTMCGAGIRVDRIIDLSRAAEALGQEIAFLRPDADTAEFGVSSRHLGTSTGDVGALTLTWLGVRDDADADAVDMLSVEILDTLRTAKGFLGAATFDVGNRKYTISAFDAPESIRSVQGKAHRRAVRKFFAGRVCSDATITTWTPRTFDSYVRCTVCETMVSARAVECCGLPIYRPSLL